MRTAVQTASCPQLDFGWRILLPKVCSPKSAYKSRLVVSRKYNSCAVHLEGGGEKQVIPPTQTAFSAGAVAWRGGRRHDPDVLCSILHLV